VSAAYSAVRAQQTQTLTSPLPPPNITSPGFKLIVCDGPAGAGHTNPADLTSPMKPGYVVCDFNAAMAQVQQLLNIAVVAAVLAAIVGFSYVGYLFVKGNPADRNKAKDIFKKLAIGFILILTAWFIVYQLLDWLTGNSAFTTLLGKP
jgi:hypothetical protein